MFANTFSFLYFHFDPVSNEQKAKEEVEGIDMENLEVLEKLRQKQRQSYLTVSECKNLSFCWLGSIKPLFILI